MNSDILERSLTLFKKAMDRFSEVKQEPESSIVMDATIQRFTFTYELMWKTLQIFLKMSTVSGRYHRDKFLWNHISFQLSNRRIFFYK